MKSNEIFKQMKEKLGKIIKDDKLACDYVDMQINFYKSLRNYTEKYGRLAESANKRSNDASHDSDMFAIKADEILTNAIPKLRREIAWLKLPWYKKLWRRINK